MMTLFEKVIADLKLRDALGAKTYGGPMLSSKKSLRAWLQESYEEQLDNLMYTKAAIEALDRERKRKRK